MRECGGSIEYRKGTGIRRAEGKTIKDAAGRPAVKDIMTAKEQVAEGICWNCGQRMDPSYISVLFEYREKERKQQMYTCKVLY